MLKGLPDQSVPSPLAVVSSNSAWTQPAGARAAMVHEARIININLVNYTVDCLTVFDQKRFFNIQVSSPYMHSFSGEGIHVMPEVGAKCLVCIPSDGPPPFVLSFIMPVEAVGASEDEEELSGVKGASTGASFAGGRTRAKPGDITIRGRDGNFAILHRGGVLQLGSTSMAQRLYIPIGNLITDVCQNYNQFNTAGSMHWGVREIQSDNPETEFKQAFRVYANDEYADIRVAVGKVQSPVAEPGGDAGSNIDLNALEIGTKKDAPIVYELVVAPGGFDTDAAFPRPNAPKETKFRFFIDQDGGSMVRAEASVSLRVKKKLRIRVDDNIEVFSKKEVNLQSEGGMRIQGGKMLELGTQGGVVKINGGTKPVATVGSVVQINIIQPIPVIVGGAPGTITAGATFQGVVSTGNSTVLI